MSRHHVATGAIKLLYSRRVCQRHSIAEQYFQEALPADARLRSLRTMSSHRKPW